MNYILPMVHLRDGSRAVRRDFAASQKAGIVEGKQRRLLLYAPNGVLRGVASDEEGTVKTFGMGKEGGNVWLHKLVRMGDGSLFFMPLWKDIGVAVKEEEVVANCIGHECVSERLVYAYELRSGERKLVEEFAKRRPFAEGVAD